MFRLFERAKKVPPPKESITKIRETLDLLSKREALLEKRSQDMVAEARRCLAAKNKRGALAALKRKRMYDLQHQSMVAACDKLEQQAMVIEGAAATMEAMAVMKEGAAAMKQIHQGLTLDGVEKIVDDAREQMELADEVNRAIAQPMGNDVLDEDDLLAELEALEQQSVDDKLLLMPEIPIPDVPAGGELDIPTAESADPKSRVRSEADQLAHLEAMMSQ